MNILNRAWDAFGRILKVVLSNSSGTEIGTLTNPINNKQVIGSAVVGPSNPMPNQNYINGAAVSNANPLPFKPMDAAGNFIGGSSFPFFTKLTDSTGAVINSTNAVPTYLADTSGNRLGTSGFPLFFKLLDSAGAAFGTASNPLNVKGTDSTLTAMGGAIGTRIYTAQTGVLAASAEVSIFGGATLGGFAATKSIRILTFAIAMNTDTGIRLKPNFRANGGGSAALMNGLYSDGSGYTVITPAYLRANWHPIFYLAVDNHTATTPSVDTDTNVVYGAGAYVIAIRPELLPFLMANGGDITLLNQSSTLSYNVTSTVLVSEVIP
ncbi:hypothetical protein DKM44_03855 [Deinococcus irradiatisoli]|uniref:Uncharacterized protein n=1 Tax=Deinococcus irradiatisoli TaxID=2202254 RepID=A0A2Z3JBE8_9DEIO|nr:hypothetical protein [Deinococcus irradiatisoli]AWN22477.1 hypothetical protein DKM44_03855 [Deinococcus irradiatisoli]